MLCGSEMCLQRLPGIFLNYWEPLWNIPYGPYFSMFHDFGWIDDTMYTTRKKNIEEIIRLRL